MQRRQKFSQFVFGQKRFVALFAISILFFSLLATPQRGQADTLYAVGGSSPVVSDYGIFTKSATGMAASDGSKITDVLAYTVQDGDSLFSIAEDFKIDVDTIRFANKIWDDALRVGQTIKILPVTGIVHKVQWGENLEKIATKYKVDADSILTQNKITEAELIAGAAIIVPGGVGVKPKPPKPVYRAKTIFKNPVAKGTLRFPTNGVYTQYYHWAHKGVDIADPSGPTVFAAKGGTVIEVTTSGWNGGYGKYILVDHGDGLMTRYAHLRDVFVKIGDTTLTGAPIGLMGSSGRSSGTHLHFEVLKDNYRQNPLAYF